MKRIVPFLFLLSYTFEASSYVNAAPNTMVTSAQGSMNENYSLGARLISAQYEYKEPDVMKIAGSLYGFGLDGLMKVQNDLFLKGDIEYLAGKPRYDGSLMSGAPQSHSSKDYLYEIRGLIGKEIPLNSSAVNLDWSAGLGHRYLNDKGQAKSSYEREQTYLYLPVILGGNMPLDSGWILRGSVEVDLFLSGENKSHLSDVHPAFPDLKFKQDSGSGSRLTAMVTKKMAKFSAFFRLDFISWDIDESDTRYLTDGVEYVGFSEPDNKTKTTYLSAGMTF